MSCPYLTISHFTVPCDLGWDSKNTHHSVNTVHDSEKRDSVKSFHPAVKNLPVSTTIEKPCLKTGLYECFCQKELRWTEKYMYQVYFGTVVHLVRVVHVFSGHFHFSRKRPLQSPFVPSWRHRPNGSRKPAGAIFVPSFCSRHSPATMRTAPHTKKSRKRWWMAAFPKRKSPSKPAIKTS